MLVSIERISRVVDDERHAFISRVIEDGLFENLPEPMRNSREWCRMDALDQDGQRWTLMGDIGEVAPVTTQFGDEFLITGGELWMPDTWWERFLVVPGWATEPLPSS